MKIIGKTLRKALVSFLGGTDGTGTPVPGRKATYVLLTEIADLYRRNQRIARDWSRHPGDAWDVQSRAAQEIANTIQTAANHILQEAL